MLDFIKSTAGVVTGAIALITALGSLVAVSLKYIDGYVRDIAKAALPEIVKSELAKSELAFGFSVYFSGDEIIRDQRRPMNRAYFYADRDYDVRISVYFTGKKFPVNIAVNGKLALPNLNDAREIDVTRWLKPTEVVSADNRWAPPTEDLDRPQYIHYIEFNPRTGHQFSKEDFHEISGVIMVKKKSR